MQNVYYLYFVNLPLMSISCHPKLNSTLKGRTKIQNNICSVQFFTNHNSSFCEKDQEIKISIALERIN